MESHNTKMNRIAIRIPMPMAIKTHTLKLNTGVVRDNAALMSGDDMFSSAGLMNSWNEMV
jgi:hypothetical protein